MRERKKLSPVKVRLSELQNDLLWLLEEAGSEGLVGAANTVRHKCSHRGPGAVDELLAALQGLLKLGFISVQVRGENCKNLWSLRDMIHIDYDSGCFMSKAPFGACDAEIILEKAGAQALGLPAKMEQRRRRHKSRGSSPN